MRFVSRRECTSLALRMLGGILTLLFCSIICAQFTGTRHLFDPISLDQTKIVSSFTRENVTRLSSNTTYNNYLAEQGDFAISPETLSSEIYLRPIADTIFESKTPKKKRRVVPRYRLKKENLSEPNARKIAMREYGGHALDEDAAAPTQANGDKYEIAQQPGDQKSNLGPVSGSGEDPLGSSGPGGVPSDTPPPLGFTPPPQVDFPIICPFNPEIPGLNCSLQRAAFK